MSKPFKSNLENLNVARFLENSKRIKGALNLAEKSKLKFKNPNALIKFVAEVSSISRTTLPRNARYMRLINEYFASKCLVDLEHFSSGTPPEILNAKISSDTLVIANLRAEVRRLTAYIENNKEAIAESKKQGIAQPSESNLAADISDTCMALLELIKWLGESVSLDAKHGVLRDLAAKPDKNIILEKKRLSPFFYWLNNVNNK